MRIQRYYIQSGKPQQNTFVKSVNWWLRYELLNERLLFSLGEARALLAEWRED